MGEFSQSLLKLTEFPFSYSLIGMLTLMFGQGDNGEELSFDNIAPLLILMGFVATTLSICDPVGALQRLMIRGGQLIWSQPSYIYELSGTKVEDGDPPLQLAENERSRREIVTDQLIKRGPRLRRLSRLQILLQKIKDIIGGFPEGRIKAALLFRKFEDQKIFGEGILTHFSKPFLFGIKYSPEALIRRYSLSLNSLADYTLGVDVKLKNSEARAIELRLKRDIIFISYLLQRLKENAVKTKWITAEIDRITALVYFMIIISLFIVVIQFNWDFLMQFVKIFQNFESTRVVILLFSVAALAAVSYMFNLRIRGLKEKARTAFRYLAALEAIKTASEDYKNNLKEIERYLNDNDWTLAGYWVNRIRDEYTNVFIEKIKETESINDDTKSKRKEKEPSSSTKNKSHERKEEINLRKV